MFFKKKTFKKKFTGCTFIFKKIQPEDLLGVEGFAPIFSLETKKTIEVKEKDFISAAIDEQELSIKDKEDDCLLIFKKHIINRCLISLRGKKEKIKLVKDLIVTDEKIITQLYTFIAINSYDLKKITTINKKKAKEIFALYQGMDFADCYFGKNKLGALEKHSFNVCIYNAGNGG